MTCDNCDNMRRAFDELSFRYSRLVVSVETAARNLSAVAWPMHEELRCVADRERDGLAIKNPEVERIRLENETLKHELESLRVKA